MTVLLAVDVGNTNTVLGVFRDNGDAGRALADPDRRGAHLRRVRGAAQDAARHGGLPVAIDRRRDHLVGRAARRVRASSGSSSTYYWAGPRWSSAPASRPACRSSTRTPRGRRRSHRQRGRRVRGGQGRLHRRRFRHRDDLGRGHPEGRVPGRRDRARESRSAPRRCTSTRPSCRASSSRARARSSRATPSRRCRPASIYGYAGMVDALVERIRAEVEFPARCIATGGLAALIATETRTIEGERRATAFPRGSIALHAQRARSRRAPAAAAAVLPARSGAQARGSGSPADARRRVAAACR